MPKTIIILIVIGVLLVIFLHLCKVLLFIVFYCIC